MRVLVNVELCGCKERACMQMTQGSQILYSLEICKEYLSSVPFYHT